MKIIDNVLLKDGNYEYIMRRISNITYNDLQTKGPKAKKNLIRILKECYINPEDVEFIELIDTKNKGYNVIVEMF